MILGVGTGVLFETLNVHIQAVNSAGNNISSGGEIIYLSVSFHNSVFVIYLIFHAFIVIYFLIDQQ